jgi:hypothetical protein
MKSRDGALRKGTCVHPSVCRAFGNSPRRAASISVKDSTRRSAPHWEAAARCELLIQALLASVGRA